MAQSISQEAVVNTGLPGATAASRYAGATTSGAPVSGTFAVGDYVVDQKGFIWICITAGSPGTWVNAPSSTYTVLTSTGNTYTVPPNVTKIRVRIRGGGGGGAGGIGGYYYNGGNNITGWPGSGGGAGYVIEDWISVSAGNILTATIGAGGSGGAGINVGAGSGAYNGNNGGDGGTTTLTNTTTSSILISVPGGGGGIAAFGITNPAEYSPRAGLMGGAGGNTYPANSNQCAPGNGGGSATNVNPGQVPTGFPYICVVGGGMGGNTGQTGNTRGYGGVAATSLPLQFIAASGTFAGTGVGLVGGTATIPGCGGGGGGGASTGNSTSYAGGNGGAGAPGLIEISY